MPANLTPDYERAELRYRQAGSDEERIEALREMLSLLPKHKGTDKMQADLKRRISQLRKSQARKPARSVDLFHVPKGGCGQVVLTGPPNSGKSLLLATTTNAPVKVADYPFTTALPAPGMWQYQDVQIQVVDTPPLTEEHVVPGLMGAIRFADVLALVVDARNGLEQADSTLRALTHRGLQLRSAPRDQLDDDPNQYPALIVAAKADLAAPGDLTALAELYAGTLDVLDVSCTTGQGLDALQQRLWELLAVVRVYTKEPGRPADHDKPFTLPAGSTVEDLAREIHRELPEKMKYARIWGHGRFDGQQVHRTEPLCDRDVVEIHQ